MDILSNLLIPIVNLDLLMLIAVGTFAGIYVGAIPGLSVTMAVSILISFTFSWEVYPALALMIGIYMGGVYGGSPPPWTDFPWPSRAAPERRSAS